MPTEEEETEAEYIENVKQKLKGLYQRIRFKLDGTPFCKYIHDAVDCFYNIFAGQFTEMPMQTDTALCLTEWYVQLWLRCAALEKPKWNDEICNEFLAVQQYVAKRFHKDTPEGEAVQHLPTTAEQVVPVSPARTGKFTYREAEEARQRQCEVDITAMAERLRDLDNLIDKRLQIIFKNTGKDGDNGVSKDIRRCVEKLWEISENASKKGELVTTYARTKMSPDRAIYLIEEMVRYNLKYAASPGDEKKSFGEAIERYIDQTWTLANTFLTKYESEDKRKDRLYQEQQEREAEEKARAVQELRLAKKLADEKVMAMYAAKRQAAEAKKQELQRQRELEEKQDLVLTNTISEARQKLIQELGTVGKTYKRLVSRFGDTNLITHPDSTKYLHDGRILRGLIELTRHMSQLNSKRPFNRSEDTYHCCQLLRDCTCYLACDGK
jgi:hypothetical protein